MRSTAFLPLAIAAALGAQTQGPPTAASVTEPGRTLQRPLDMVLGGKTNEALERTVIVVVDPTKALADAGFARGFAAAVESNKKTLARTRLGLGIAGQPGCIVVEPTLEHRMVVAELQRRLARPVAEFLNVYAAVRQAADGIGRTKGERIVLLVTLENGDVEDDVDKTVQTLRKAKVKLEVLTSEATLADSYWAARPYQDKPRGTSLAGPDGAVVDLPWGFVFQHGSANEVTPAGYAMWGLTRLAAGTEGRVFLHATSSQIKHECAAFGQCLFCNGDHQTADDRWNSALVAQLAPIVASRKDSYSALGRDPSFRAMIDVWRAGARAGLLRSEPSVKVSVTTATPDRSRAGRNPRLVDTASFGRNAKRAEKAAAKAKSLRDKLARELERIPAGSSTHRARAAARYTVVLLQLTRVNLLTFAAWCREDGPALFDGDTELLLPEVASVDGERRPHGIGFTVLCLCHGVRPFYDVELPGGEALLPELQKLDELFTGFMHRYGKSQFGYALRRNGIARFHPTFPGIAHKPPRKRPKSSNAPVVPITPRRPARRGGASTSAGGPVTGGGR